MSIVGIDRPQMLICLAAPLLARRASDHSLEPLNWSGIRFTVVPPDRLPISPSGAGFLGLHHEMVEGQLP
jgi:hypothetical protein